MRATENTRMTWIYCDMILKARNSANYDIFIRQSSSMNWRSKSRNFELQTILLIFWLWTPWRKKNSRDKFAEESNFPMTSVEQGKLPGRTDGWSRCCLVLLVFLLWSVVVIVCVVPQNLLIDSLLMHRGDGCRGRISQNCHCSPTWRAKFPKI